MTRTIQQLFDLKGKTALVTGGTRPVRMLGGPLVVAIEVTYVSADAEPTGCRPTPTAVVPKPVRSAFRLVRQVAIESPETSASALLSGPSTSTATFQSPPVPARHASDAVV